MPKCSMLLLVAGAIAGGCSRDAPLVAPQIGDVDAIVAPSRDVSSSAVDLSADVIDEALIRLVPALGEHGTAVRSTLLKLKTDRSDKATRNELRRVLDVLDSTLPAQYRADLDALRLELDVPMKSTPTITYEDSHD